ncbi:MAG: hypothetical protein HQK55_10280 [Deltaproteobacteria bacterium]|nr:hypothetical protein [Deltaproteobacteria bacterium]
MRSFGRVRRLTISSRFLWLTGLFALGFSIVSVLSINRWLELSVENQELKARLEKVSRIADDIRFQSKVLDHYQQLVGELNKTDPKKPAESLAKIDAPPMMVASQPDPPRPPEPPQPQSSPAGTTITTGLVDAEKLTMEPEGDNKALRFQFNLNNLHPEIRSVSGYIFLVLGNPTAGSPAMAVYPEVDFKQGKPSEIKKGSQFNIRNGKTVRGRIDKLTGASTYKQAWVYAYADDGQLLLKKLLTAENG